MTTPRYVSMAADYIWSTGLIGQFVISRTRIHRGRRSENRRRIHMTEPLRCGVQHNPMSLIFKESVGGQIDQIDQYDFIFGWSI